MWLPVYLVFAQYFITFLSLLLPVNCLYPMASMASTATSAACITINVKTMDASNFQMSVSKDSSIPDLKSKIAGHTGFENHRQRLIFQGRVLRNDKNVHSCPPPNFAKLILFVARQTLI